MENTTRPKDTEQQYQADVDPTLDSLQLLLREAGRFTLLTPAEEIELAKRIEKGDLAAKERMINSNLRLVVRTRAATRVRASRWATSSRRACSA
jgi:RNA polymerase primary sigma factor